MSRWYVSDEEVDRQQQQQLREMSELMALLPLSSQRLQQMNDAAGLVNDGQSYQSIIMCSIISLLILMHL